MPDADEDDSRLLAEAVRAAGAVALGYFRADPRRWTKGAGDSPVSEADLAADQRLKDILLAARPDYGWLSEESAASPDRLSRRRVFVVDPIDGTRGFLQGEPGWMVSAAIVEDGRPVAAALAAPAEAAIFRAARRAGAFRDGVRLSVTDVAAPEDARVAGAKAPLPVKLPEFREMVPRIPALALRFTRVAEGALDAAFSRPDSHDWDVAAADLLVHEAGGTLVTLAGSPPRYNGADPRHPPLLAAGPALARAILSRFTSAA